MNSLNIPEKIMKWESGEEGREVCVYLYRVLGIQGRLRRGTPLRVLGITHIAHTTTLS